jgi:hypothetical protein
MNDRYEQHCVAVASAVGTLAALFGWLLIAHGDKVFKAVLG